MFNSKIHNCNNDLLEKQKQELINEIINGINDTYFKVFDLECGTGKTRVAEIALSKLATQTSKKAIFVRPDNADGVETANIINELTGKTVAFAYNGDTVPDDNKIAFNGKLGDYSILIITHSKYLVLATDIAKRKLFTSGRSVLVIDEAINEIRHLNLSQLDIDTYKLIFQNDYEMLNTYHKAIWKLEDMITNNPTGRYPIKINEYGIIKNIDLLIKYIRHNMTNKTLNKIIEDVLASGADANSILLGSIKTVKSLISHMDDIKEYYKNLCVLDNGCFHVADSKMKKWLLVNNIILDASGELQASYMDKTLYKINGNEKVLSHHNWSVIHVPVNTTTNGKTKIVNFYDEVNSIVKYYGKADTLVVGAKHDIDRIDVPNENKGYFGNIVGKNTWRDLKNVVIMQTPNLSDIEYILRYFYYSKDFITENIVSKTSGRNITIRYSFSDARFERVRTLFVAEQIYQCVKRVNRNMRYSTNAIIIINNDDVMELLKQYLKDCRYELLDNSHFRYQHTKQDAYVEKLKKGSHAQKFKDLLAEMEFGKHTELLHHDKNGNGKKGVYSKKAVREYLGLNSSSAFSHKVLCKTDIVSYCKIRNIDISGQYIIISENLQESASA